jgi:hypothetical protein
MTLMALMIMFMFMVNNGQYIIIVSFESKSTV